MKRIAAAVLVTAIAGTMTACGGDNAPTKEEGIYALTVQTSDPDLTGTGDLSTDMIKTLASEGHDICTDLKHGETVAGEISKVSLGFKPKDAAVLVGAAPALCPDQAAKIKAAGTSG